MALRLIVLGLFLVVVAIAGVFLYAALGDPQRLARTPADAVLVADERLGPWQLRAEVGDDRSLYIMLAPATEATADPRRPPPTVRLDMPAHGMATEPIRLAARMDAFVAAARLPMPGEWRLMVHGADDSIRFQVR